MGLLCGVEASITAPSEPKGHAVTKGKADSPRRDHITRSSKRVLTSDNASSGFKELTLPKALKLESGRTNIATRRESPQKSFGEKYEEWRHCTGGEYFRSRQNLIAYRSNTSRATFINCSGRVAELPSLEHRVRICIIQYIGPLDLRM